jgi:hypothetical protein
MLYESLFNNLLHLDGNLRVYPAHDYKGREHSTLAHEVAQNPRLAQRDRSAFIELMRALDLDAPTHLTEALRTNHSGGKTVAGLIAEAAEKVPFMSMQEVKRRLESPPAASLLDA